MIELLSVLRLASLTSTAALLAVLLLRNPMRLFFRSRAAYALWALVPLSMIAVLLPSPTKLMAAQSTTASSLGKFVPGLAMHSRLSIADSAFDVALLVTVIWALGIVVTLFLFLRQQNLFIQSLGQVSVVSENIFRAQTSIGCPALVGALRPRIILPADFDLRYSEEEQKMILAHEHHHRFAGDAQVNVLCVMFRCVFWFNPLIHLGSVLFRLDQELACDEAVIAFFRGKRRSYANAMLKAQLTETKLPMGCYWPPKNAMLERITVLRLPLIGRRRAIFGSSIAFILVACGGYAAWAVQPPRILYTPTQNDGMGASEMIAQNRAARGAEASKVAPVGLSRSSKVPTLAHGTSKKPFMSDRPSEIAHPSTDDRLAHANGALAVASLPNGGDTPKYTYSNVTDLHALGGMPDSRLASTDQAAEEVPAYRETYPPRYPPEAIREHVQGDVVLRVRVDQAGVPLDAQIESLTPTTATNLASSSIAAVMTWRFHPAMHDGKPTAGIAVVPFSFRITNGADTPSTIVENSGRGDTGVRGASYQFISAIDYPQDQSAAGKQGVITLRVLVAADGEVTSTNIDGVEPPSARALATTAANAVSGWKFSPARNGGRNVASTISVPVVFSLQPNPRAVSIGRRVNTLDPIVVLPKG